MEIVEKTKYRISSIRMCSQIECALGNRQNERTFSILVTNLNLIFIFNFLFGICRDYFVDCSNFVDLFLMICVADTTKMSHLKLIECVCYNRGNMVNNICSILLYSKICICLSNIYTKKEAPRGWGYLIFMVL